MRRDKQRLTQAKLPAVCGKWGISTERSLSAADQVGPGRLSWLAKAADVAGRGDVTLNFAH